MPMPSSVSLRSRVGHGDAVLDLVPQTQRVPVQRALHAHRRIGKAVQFFDTESPSRTAEHRAPALGAQIDRKVVAHENAILTYRAEDL